MKNVSAALVKAQKQFGPALKSSTNPHFKSKYADLAACVEAVIEALNASGIALMQRTIECADGVTVETVFVHESGETLSSGPLHVPAAKQDPQGYGSALTYARRYSLMAACGIAPEDDDGNAATHSAPQRKENGRLPGVGVHRPTDGMLDSLPEDMQLDIRLVASVLPGIFEKQGIEAAFDKIESKQYENDEKVALWHLLDSKLRSALKREGEKRHIAARNPAIEAGLPAH
jgi:hypothetical protein